MTLGRKQSIPDLATWQAALDQVDPHQADALFDLTVAKVRRYAAGKRVAFGWSGGKDSLVLQAVMEAAGIFECVLVLSEVEYPAFLRWATDNMPHGLTVVTRPIGYDYLRAHPEMVFPATSTLGARWFRIVQHTGQADHFRAQGLDLLALGRRRADGNHVGDPGACGAAYTNREGITRWSPLADWSHEDVLAIIKRERMELPPCYEWPRGFQVGTGPWPARQWTGDAMTGWREVWTIDPAVVRAAAREGIVGAAAALSALA